MNHRGPFGWSEDKYRGTRTHGRHIWCVLCFLVAFLRGEGNSEGRKGEHPTVGKASSTSQLGARPIWHTIRLGRTTGACVPERITNHQYQSHSYVPIIDPSGCKSKYSCCFSTRTAITGIQSTTKLHQTSACKVNKVGSPLHRRS